MPGPSCSWMVVCAAAACLLLHCNSDHAVAQDKPADSIQRSLRANLQYLASDELKGRSVTDETIDVAADYIAKRFTEIGLKTDLYDGTPFQSVDVNVGSGIGSDEKNQLTFRNIPGVTAEATSDAPKVTSLKLGDGFSPLAIGAGNASVSAPVAFVGYGITAPKIGYDDYKGLDVSGCVVVLLRKEPQLGDPDSPFDGTKNSRHAFFVTKINNAIKQGAAAVLIVNDPASIEDAVRREEQRREQELERRAAIKKQLKQLPAEAKKNRKALAEKLDNIGKIIGGIEDDIAEARRGVLDLSTAGGPNRQTKSIPVVSVARDVISNLIENESGKSLEEIESDIDETLRPQSMFLENLNASVLVDLKPAVAKTKNVLGMLPGKGALSTQTVVVGAHYDHVGMGGYGSLAPGTIAIHNGADDNASGTCTMLACAQSMVDRLRNVDSHRTMLFIAFTGEERGLIGSKAYVDSPLRSLDETAVMVNLDMVGRLRDNELTVYGTGSADTLDATVETANQQHRFDLFKVASGYGPSDHQSFYVAGVPVLFFFTGLHNDYHRPTDDFDKINMDDLNRVAAMVTDVTYRLSTESRRPVYAETQKGIRVRRQLTVYLGVTLSDRGDHVVLSSVAEDSPAEKGGLLLGDRLEKMGKSNVPTSADVLSWLRGKSPGDQISLSILRDGKPMQLDVKLGKRE